MAYTQKSSTTYTDQHQQTHSSSYLSILEIREVDGCLIRMIVAVHPSRDAKKAGASAYFRQSFDIRDEDEITDYTTYFSTTEMSKEGNTLRSQGYKYLTGKSPTSGHIDWSIFEGDDV